MSQQDLELVWDIGTFEGWPDVAQYRGPDGFAEFFAKWTDAYEEWDLDVEDLVDAGGERVVAVLTQRGRLKGSDAWVELRFAILYTLTDGLITRMQLFNSPDEALEAVGRGA